jgi:hypothetical protein
MLKLIPVLLVLVIFLTFPLDEADGLNGWGKKHSYTYYCDESINNISHLVPLDPCLWVDAAAVYWSIIPGTDFSFIKSTNSTADVTIKLCEVYKKYLAELRRNGDLCFFDGKVWSDFNGMKEWCPCKDFTGIILHEFGHVAGLDHSNNEKSMMYYKTGIFKSPRTIDADDFLIFQRLHPLLVD